jgi:uncharacterized membrane protein
MNVESGLVGPTNQRQRIAAIDIIRGAAIVFMMLDHTRDFVHRDGLTVDPTDLTTTSPMLFLTRFVTHYCAPVFIFLAGISARIQIDQGQSSAFVSQYLWKRGVFLIALELLVLRPSIWFNFDYILLAHLQVIWVIGWSMILLAGLVRLPLWVSFVFGAVLVLGHNSFDQFQVNFPATTWKDALWVLLHQKSGIEIGGQGGTIVFVQYPLIPWVGVMALGYFAGVLFRFEPARRKKWLAFMGLAALVGFVSLRFLNVYGDPAHWSFPSEGVDSSLTNWQWTFFSFINTQKYPPSLLFLLMTLGPMFLGLAVLDGRPAGWLGRRLLTFGSVPLFFYLLQWPTVYLMSQLFQWIAGQPMGWDSPNPMNNDGPLPEGQGFGLGVVYLGWAIGLIVLYPLCAWYAALKRRHPTWNFLSYI